MNDKNLTFGYRQHQVFIGRSKLWSTSQRHIVSESTAMSFTELGICTYCAVLNGWIGRLKAITNCLYCRIVCSFSHNYTIYVSHIAQLRNLRCALRLIFSGLRNLRCASFTKQFTFSQIAL